MKHLPTILTTALCVLTLTACSSEAVYTKESFAADSPFQKRVAVKTAVACESARRALLSQGYLIDSASNEQVKGRKAYKSEDERSTFIEMQVVCASDNTGSTLYATALLSTYAVKKTGSSASVGVKAVGSVSLPFGQSADSMVKVSDETIDDKKFYKRFFVAVDNILKETRPAALPQGVEVFPAR
jgi:hypothetical protein